MFGAIRGVLYFPHYYYSPISLFSLIYSFLFPLSYFLFPLYITGWAVLFIAMVWLVFFRGLLVAFWEMGGRV